MRFVLRGTEERTLEIDGRVEASAARRLVEGSRLELDLDGGSVAASLLVFRMRGMRAFGLPAPELDYDEALWRLAVRRRGEAAWLGVVCDLDSALVRVTGRWLVRYPVRRARFDLDEVPGTWSARIVAEPGLIDLVAVPGEEEPDAQPPRRLIVRSSDAEWTIPWAEDAAPWRRRAVVRVDRDDLGRSAFGAAVEWSTTGTLHRGRVHRCGIATRS